MFDLARKVALITGAGSGIGAAIAALFARQGARIVVLDIDESADAARCGDRLGGRRRGCAPLQCRRRPTRSRTPSATWRRELGRLDILVNNAGIAHVGTIEQTTPEDDLDRLYAVNVKGVFLCSRRPSPIMLRQGGGVILNMASIASLVGVPDRFAYSMTKGAVSR